MLTLNPILYAVLVGSNNSVTVDEDDNIVLSCMGPTLSVPSDGVVWMKDGVMISEQVKLVLPKIFANSFSKYQIQIDGLQP